MSTLPEGEENHRLDHQELQHGAVGAEQLPGGEVKEEEGVQGQAHGEVVDDGHVQVTAGNAEEEETGNRFYRDKDCCGSLSTARQKHPPLPVGGAPMAAWLHYAKRRF